MIRKILVLTALALFVFGYNTVMTQVVRADDNTISKQTADKIDDAKTDTTKSVRKLKRTARKATGTDTAVKDVKDKASDVGDDAKNTVNKATN